jgi:SAM-dependent methyltransferase
MINYLEGDYKRFLYTLNLIPDGTGRLMEIGANPYYMSMLIRRFTQFELHCSNYFGPGLNSDGVQYMVNSNNNEKIEFKFKHFNIEDEEIPCSSQSFDVILFCEVIEHFTKDPMRALLNVKKALKPNGYLILSTPNVARLDNVAKLMAGANIYDPYSGHGIYGRHNREYNKHELYLLLTHLGFDIEIIFSADVHANTSGAFFDPDKFIHLLEFRKNDLGQYIFLRAKNTREPNTKKPSWLYRSYNPDELCT